MSSRSHPSRSGQPAWGWPETKCFLQLFATGGMLPGMLPYWTTAAAASRQVFEHIHALPSVPSAQELPQLLEAVQLLGAAAMSALTRLQQYQGNHTGPLTDMGTIIYDLCTSLAMCCCMYATAGQGAKLELARELAAGVLSAVAAACEDTAAVLQLTKQQLQQQQVATPGQPAEGLDERLLWCSICVGNGLLGLYVSMLTWWPGKVLLGRVMAPTVLPAARLVLATLQPASVNQLSTTSSTSGRGRSSNGSRERTFGAIQKAGTIFAVSAAGSLAHAIVSDLEGVVNQPVVDPAVLQLMAAPELQQLLLAHLAYTAAALQHQRQHQRQHQQQELQQQERQQQQQVPKYHLQLLQLLGLPSPDDLPGGLPSVLVDSFHERDCYAVVTAVGYLLQLIKRQAEAHAASNTSNSIAASSSSSTTTTSTNSSKGSRQVQQALAVSLVLLEHQLFMPDVDILANSMRAMALACHDAVCRDVTSEGFAELYSSLAQPLLQQLAPAAMQALRAVAGRELDPKVACATDSLRRVYTSLVLHVLQKGDHGTLQLTIQQEPQLVTPALEAGLRLMSCDLTASGCLTHPTRIPPSKILQLLGNADICRDLCECASNATASLAVNSAAAAAATAAGPGSNGLPGIQQFALLLSCLKFASTVCDPAAFWPVAEAANSTAAAGMQHMEPFVAGAVTRGAAAAAAGSRANTPGSAQGESSSTLDCTPAIVSVRTSCSRGSSGGGSSSSSSACQPHAAVGPANACWLVLVARNLWVTGQWLTQVLHGSTGTQHSSGSDQDAATATVALHRAGQVCMALSLLSTTLSTVTWLGGMLDQLLPGPLTAGQSEAGAALMRGDAAAGAAGAVAGAVLGQQALEQLQQQHREVQGGLAAALQQWEQYSATSAGQELTSSSSASSSSTATTTTSGTSSYVNALQHYKQVLSAELAQQLQDFAAALCSHLPLRHCCNHPACVNMAQLSELELVGGKSCICAGCQVARYCSKQCQTAHWKQHRPVCKRIRAAQAAAGVAAKDAQQ